MNSLTDWVVASAAYFQFNQSRRTGWLWYKWRVINFSSEGREHMDARATEPTEGGEGWAWLVSQWHSVHAWIRSQFERFVCRQPPLCQQSLSSCRHASVERSSPSACVPQILRKFMFHLSPGHIAHVHKWLAACCCLIKIQRCRTRTRTSFHFYLCEDVHGHVYFPASYPYPNHPN